MSNYVFDGALPDLSTIDDVLVESVLICLFTDKYVPDEQMPYQLGSNGGWHGDAIPLGYPEIDDTDYSWGSRLWTLKRAKITDETPTQVKEMIEEALDPLLLLKEVEAIHVTTERSGDTVLFEVIILRPNNDPLNLLFKNMIGGKNGE